MMTEAQKRATRWCLRFRCKKVDKEGEIARGLIPLKKNGKQAGESSVCNLFDCELFVLLMSDTQIVFGGMGKPGDWLESSKVGRRTWQGWTFLSDEEANTWLESFSLFPTPEVPCPSMLVSFCLSLPRPPFPGKDHRKAAKRCLPILIPFLRIEDNSPPKFKLYSN